MNPPEEINQTDELSTEEFERQLTQALRRVAAPEGFTARTMARLEPAVPAPARLFLLPAAPRSRAWASGVLAATLVVTAFLIQQVHVRHQRHRADLAQQQFEAGVRITDDALDHIRFQLQQAGIEAGK